MVEPSFPPSRVGAAAVPDSIFLTRQMIIPLGLPNADSAVPQSPVSGNVPSARGLPLAGSGIGSTPRLGGMSLKISFIPSGSRCPTARPETSPSTTLQTISLSLSWCLGDRDGTPAFVSMRHSSCRNARRCVLPGGTPSPGTPSVSTQGWPAPSRPAAKGCELWEAGCLSLTRVSQASATISCVMDLSADDDEATARSFIGSMASATLRRPISCSSVAAATRPSLVLGDSSVPPASTMSWPGVWGNDVTGDAIGPTSVIRSLDPTGPNPCWSGDTSGCSGSEGTTTTDRSDGVGSRSSARSWR